MLAMHRIVPQDAIVEEFSAQQHCGDSDAAIQQDADSDENAHHPGTDDRTAYTAPLPADMAQTVAFLSGA